VILIHNRQNVDFHAGRMVPGPGTRKVRAGCSSLYRV